MLRLVTPRVGARNGIADVKVSDHTMTILTGLVLTVTIGMLAQNSESIMAGLSGANVLQPEDDVFTVRAGKPQSLNVLLNDQAPDGATETAILIMEEPICGELALANGQIEYTNSQTCNGPVTFTYCLAADVKCVEAKVALQVMPYQGAVPVVASAELAHQVTSPKDSAIAESADVAQAPTLAEPLVADDLEPAVVTAALDDNDPALALENEPITVLAELPPIAQTPVAIDLTLPDRLASAEISPASTGLPPVETAELLPMEVAEMRLKDDLNVELSVSVPIVLANVATTAEMPATIMPVESLAIISNETAAEPGIELVTEPATCAVETVALPVAGGEIALSLTAPCMPNSPLVIRQADFEFSAMTDNSGAFAATFPAFSTLAAIELLLPDGVTKSIAVDVPGAGGLHRQGRDCGETAGCAQAG